MNKENLQVGTRKKYSVIIQFKAKKTYPSVKQAQRDKEIKTKQIAPYD